MSDDQLGSEEFHFWNLSDTDRAPHLQGTIGEVFGSKWFVGGYNALEEIQRRVRLESMTQHMSEIHQWYRGLTLYFVAQYGAWDLSSSTISEERLQARGVQMDLLGLGLSSAKVAIDTLLTGYYSVAFATIRHMTETVLQCFYLEAFPERAFLWRDEPTPENIKRMGAGRIREKLVKRVKSIKPESDRQPLTEYVEEMFRSWKLLSGGSHPSGSGLAQVVWPESDDMRLVGGTYERYMTLVGFDHGFFAMQGLIEQFEYSNRVNEEWRQRFDYWQEEVADFRLGLKSDPAGQKFVAALEASRKARADAAEDCAGGDIPGNQSSECPVL